MAEKISASAASKAEDKVDVEVKEVLVEAEVSKKFVMLADGVPGGTFAGSLISFKEGAKYPVDSLDDDFVAALVTRNIVVLVD